jgi:thioredoxin reductase (NADPH)
MAYREHPAPGMAEHSGAGVYYGASSTEAPVLAGQRVVVIGGGNSAGQSAMFLSRYASDVQIVIRSGSLRDSMSQYLIDQIASTPNIDVQVRTEVAEAHGIERLEALTLSDCITSQTRTVPAAALFLFIGAVPHSDLVAGVVERNSAGFILTGQDLIRDGKKPQGWRLQRDPYLLETSVPGIFAAGDIRQGAVRRVASAVGEGAVAVSLVHQYLKTV